jgi:arylsulfatase A-like enzyme
VRRAALLLALLACGGEPPAPQPHIVLVVCDALRADRLDLYGAARPTAPQLSAWAQDALVFEAATAPSNWTRPSVHALFTGLAPAPDRAFGSTEKLPDEPVLAERLHEAGYETAAISANPFVSRAYGADRGFTTFLDLGWHGEERSGHWKQDIASPAVLDRVEHLLSSRTRERPLFLYVHLMDPHLPYDPPAADRDFCDPAYAGRIDGSREPYLVLRGPQVNERLGPGDAAQVQALYDGEIQRLDAGLARLRGLVTQWLGDRPVVQVVTADHGEAFGEGSDGFYQHGHGLHPGLLRVPLVLAGAGGAGRVPERVSLLDLSPTLLALARVEAPEGDGLDLRRAAAGRDLIAYRALPPSADESAPPGPVAARGELAVLRDGWRCERLPEGWRLLEDATGADVTADHEALRDELVRAAARWEAQRRGDAVAADGLSLTPAEAAQLEQLGYVGK